MEEREHSGADPAHANATWGLVNAIKSAGDRAVRLRDYIGRKVARDALQELDILGDFDDSLETALVDLAGTGVVAGILLSISGYTSTLDIEAETVRLPEPVPAELRPIAQKLTQYMIPEGISFQQSELRQSSPRVEEWIDEFRELPGKDIILG